jgi:D-alanyl-D-alanine carboxypeptidase
MVAVHLTRRQLLQCGVLLSGAPLLSGALSSCAPRQIESADDAVDTYITGEMPKRRIPGLALAVVQHGKTVKAQGYGLANLELDVPVGPETVFELASLTKQFTATAIMLLVEAGRVGLDDPIGDHIAYPMPAKWDGITVRHLLTHTAGLAGLATGFAALSAGPPRLDISTLVMFDAATKDPMSSRPGTAWQYSDVGYFLLGMVIERASGRRYQDFLTDHFFLPLGMNATSVPDRSVIIKNRAAGYTLRDGEVVHIRRNQQVELSSYVGVYSTVQDLAKWENALAAGRVVKASSLEQMWTPVQTSTGSTHPYGFGWEVKEQRGHRLITHAGITGTEYARFPDDGLTVIVLTNLGNRIGAPPVKSWGLTLGVAGLIIPDLR